MGEDRALVGLAGNDGVQFGILEFGVGTFRRVQPEILLAGLGIVTYMAAARLLKMPELGWAIRGK